MVIVPEAAAATTPHWLADRQHLVEQSPFKRSMRGNIALFLRPFAWQPQK